MSNIEEFMSTQAKSGKEFALGIDENGNLYVNGKEVVTKQKFTLGWIINFSVVLGGLGAFVQGIVSLIEHFT
jgi:hypothetical protein